MKLDILNTPAYAVNYRYIVYRMSMGARWFWGAFSDGGKAAQVATEIGGFVYDKEGNGNDS